jgi:hypothetical protein
VASPATPSPAGGKVPVRAWAAVLSAVLTMLGLSLLEAPRPPAATMLVVADRPCGGRRAIRSSGRETQKFRTSEKFGCQS